MSLFCSLFNRSVVSNLFDPMDYNWLLCPRISSGKNTGVGCHSLYQGIFLTQGSNLRLPHCRQILYCLSHHEERKPHINLYLYVCVCVCVLSCFSHVPLSVTSWTVAHQAPLSMGFSRQEYWSGLPCPSSGDLPDAEIEPTSPA